MCGARLYGEIARPGHRKRGEGPALLYVVAKDVASSPDLFSFLSLRRRVQVAF